MKLNLRKFVLLAMTIIIVLTMVELVLRMAWALVGEKNDTVPEAARIALRARGWEPNATEQRILKDDPLTLWSLVSNYEGKLPSYLPNGVPWSVQIGPHGFRGEKGPSLQRTHPSLRIACIGDSCTFGLLVNEGQTYPDHLRSLLQSRYPNYTIEVISYGIPGFTSEQGRILLEQRVLQDDPDIVVLSFAFNDTWPAFQSDLALIEMRRSIVGKVRETLSKCEIYRTLFSLLNSYVEHKDLPLSTTRVSADRFVENIRYMIRKCRTNDIDIILLNQEYPSDSTIVAYQNIADTEDVPMIDARSSLHTGGPIKITKPVREALTFFPPTGNSHTAPIIMEVFVPKKFSRPISIVGNAPSLGSGIPGLIRLLDNGVIPDKKANDGIHAIMLKLPINKRIRYLFQSGGDSNSWIGLESRITFRQLSIPPHDLKAKHQLVPRIKHHFAKLPLMMEPIHPNSLGYFAVAVLTAQQIELICNRHQGGSHFKKYEKTDNEKTKASI